MNNQLRQYIDQGYAIITASQRQAHALKMAYANAMLEDGKTVWRTPEIKTWPVWMLNTWDDQQGDSSKVLLSPSQLRLIWESIIENSSYTKDILQVDTLIDTAIEAYDTCMDWEIEIFPEQTFLNNDTRAFKTWVRSYRSRLAEKGWLDAVSIPGELISRQFTPAVTGVVIYGFDQVTKTQAGLLEYIKSSDCEVIKFKPDNRNESCVYYGYSQPEEEIKSAAAWARQILINEPDASIGIVLPDLNKRRSAVTATFDSVFHPDWSLRQPGTFQRQYSIAPGRPLSDYPMVHAAIEILSLGHGRVPVQRLEFLLRSSFIKGNDSESTQRALFYQAIRDSGEPVWHLATLLEYVQLHQQYLTVAKDFLNRFDQCQELIKGFPTTQSPRKWSDSFNQFLKLFGWPGDRSLNSIEFQTLKAWREALLELALMGTVSAKWNFMTAFSNLKEVLANRSFQPETIETPIQVSGLPGIAGMGFDYLRVIGMHDLIWPGPAMANPFIPLTLQQQANVPGSSARQIMDQCIRETDALIASAHHVVFSYAKQEGDREFRPSPILRRYLTDLPTESNNEISDYQTLIFQTRDLESFIDDTAPPFTGDDVASGGTGILSDQSACPFRAFAHRRLHAQGLADVSIGLDPATRGSLVHEVMHGVWGRIKSSDELKDMPTSKLTSLINSVAAGAIRDHAKLKPETFTPEFRKLETQRLVNLVTQWLNIEKARSEFTVRDLEKRHDINFHGINLRMRIDRVDELSEGGQVLIDYKTGDVSIKKWESDRPEEPQLPLYAVTLKDDIKAVAFAGMKKGKLGYAGLGESSDLIEGVKTAGETEAEWQQQLQEWETVLANLADEYLQGHASVTPTETACRYCDLHSLCRIHEREWLMDDNMESEE